MPNTFTTVTRQGFGSRIMGAIVAVPIGIVLILGSCIMLYWNEGRTDYSKIAAKSVPVQAGQVNQSENGQFVSVTGGVSANQPVGDGAYLKPGPYVAVQRTVEEYAWVQSEQTKSQDNTGGSSTDTTTYTYKQQWTDDPADSTTFQHPQGHQNPPLPLNSTNVEAASGRIGAYSFDPQTIKLPTLQALSLSTSNVNVQSVSTAAAPIVTTPAAAGTIANISPLSNITLASSEYLYGGPGSLTAPQTGSIRISYQALQNGTTATVFGQLNNGSLGSYTDPNNHTLYDLLLGDRQTAIATLHSQYETTTWILRGVGLVLIWIGLMMLFGPLDMLLDFIPVVGEIGGIITFIITLPVALVLGGTVIIIGYTMHHVVALLIGVPLILAIWFGIFKVIKKARNIPKRGSGNAPPPAPPPPPGAPSAPSAPSSQAPSASQVPASGSLFPTSPAPPAPPQPSQPVPPNPVPAPVPPTPPVVSPSPPPAPPQPPRPGNDGQPS